MANPALIRRALDALAVTLDGRAAAAATITRKRAIFYSALQYAVELGLLSANPIDRVQWKTPRNTDAVDRRVVVNPDQARSLLAGVREIEPALEAFYACMYYAATRPAEALHLRAADCTLPEENEEDQWGELLLNGSTQHVGHAWSDSGNAKEDRALKHRADKDTRTVPACPELVRILRNHIKQFGTSPDGRLFVTRTARFGRALAGPYNSPVSNNTYGRVWRKARGKTLPADQVASPLAARPYDLRHAAVSLWLNAGVPATQVAEWAGHSVHVLLKVYAKCIYGQEEAARRRIEAALSDPVQAQENPAIPKQDGEIAA
jgi:integrase